MSERDHTVHTRVNNVVGTLNLLYAIKGLRCDCQLVKVSTTRECASRNIDIEEAFIAVNQNGRENAWHWFQAQDQARLA